MVISQKLAVAADTKSCRMGTKIIGTKAILLLFKYFLHQMHGTRPYRGIALGDLLVFMPLFLPEFPEIGSILCDPFAVDFIQGAIL